MGWLRKGWEDVYGPAQGKKPTQAAKEAEEAWVAEEEEREERERQDFLRQKEERKKAESLREKRLQGIYPILESFGFSDPRGSVKELESFLADEAIDYQGYPDVLGREDLQKEYKLSENDLNMLFRFISEA